MSKLVFSGQIKIPRAKGVATITHLRRPNGCTSENPEDWAVVQEQVADNLVLDQAMAMYSAHAPAGGSVSNQPDSQARLKLHHLFSAIFLSDDGVAPNAANTAMAGTTVVAGEGTSYLVEDAGDHLSSGIHYTKVTRSGVMFASNYPANTTFRKIYGTSTGIGTANPSLAAGSPVSELLLPSPITIADPTKEAIKVSYSIYWPRMGDVNNYDQGTIVCGSGSIVLQDRDLNDAITSGPTVGWTMKYAGHRAGEANGTSSGTPPEDLYGSITTPMIPDPGVVGSVYRATDVGGVIRTLTGRDSADITITNPSATSKKYAFSSIFTRTGNVGGSRTFAAVQLLWTAIFQSYGYPENAGSPWWVEFDQAITVDWTQTLEIHAELTIDWS